MLSPVLAGSVSLGMFWTWYTALVELVLVGALTWYAIKRYEKHHDHAEYDDHGDNNQAIQKYIEDQKTRSRMKVLARSHFS